MDLHRVRVEPKIHRMPSATNDHRYAVFTVPRMSQLEAVSDVPLAELLSGTKPFSVYLFSPVSIICSLLGLFSSSVESYDIATEQPSLE